MSSSIIDQSICLAQSVEVTDDTLSVQLQDGRAISAPLVWYPRLLHGTLAERKNFRLIGRGQGIHWSDLDEDISINNLLLGQRSNESQQSLLKWLQSRQV
jgi:hypothetical protein